MLHSPSLLPWIMSPEKQHELRNHVAQRLGLAGPHKVNLVVLPPMRTQFVPVTPARKAKFAANLEDAYYARPERDKVPKASMSLDDASLLAVCRTCRGSCCKWGEDHAYLTRANLRRLKSEQKFANLETLLEAYLQRVPDSAYSDSCIYQGPQGCVLPRHMRSETCNRYICYPLKQLGQGFEGPGYAQLAVAETEASEDDRVLLLDNGKTEDL